MDDPRRFGALYPVGVHMAHDIVADFLFPCLGDLKIDVVAVGFQLGDLLVGNIKPQRLFRFRKRNPQLPPGAEFEGFGENELHLVACVARRERRNVLFLGICHVFCLSLCSSISERLFADG